MQLSNEDALDEKYEEITQPHLFSQLFTITQQVRSASRNSDQVKADDTTVPQTGEMWDECYQPRASKWNGWTDAEWFLATSQVRLGKT